MARGRRRKKRFKECGHVGFGKYCHYCKQGGAPVAKEEAPPEAATDAATEAAPSEAPEPKKEKRPKSARSAKGEPPAAT
ncbi:MAG: hypothetical protein HY720_27275 [Planctomycetes bacterium]|nr:hypothetical protein [Planctomycetota bacterium]